MSDMKLETMGDILVVRFHGRLDAKAVEENRDEFRKVAAKRVLLNLGEVTFLDSSGLGMIVSAMRRQRESGGDLILCCLTPAAKTIFELTRLHKVFDIYESEAQAVAA